METDDDQVMTDSIGGDGTETKAASGPRLWPVLLALTLLLWVITMTGGRQIFVKEVLGGAYDSQAKHLLHGDAGVDVDAIQHEAIIFNGRVCMYFGPFPALLRIPLNFIYPPGRGAWSRFSGFCAGVIALFAFAGLVREGLRASKLSTRVQNWIGNVCVIGFALGSPLLFLLGNLSIYSEAIVWGLAWSLAALFFAWRSTKSHGRKQTYAILGFSLCVGAALLSRVTFGAPLFLIAPMLAFRLPCKLRLLVALIAPLGAALAFHLLFSYARFGSFTGASLEHYINPVHREFAHKHWMFNLKRVPYSFADYFSLQLPSFQTSPPFLRADRHPYVHPHLFSLPFSETYLSVTWCSAWLVFGSIIGLIYLFQKNRADILERGIAAALFAQFICILSFFALAQRYSAELYPFLIFCLIIFLRRGPTSTQRAVLIALVLVSVVLNSLATASWLAGDGNLPVETRVFWSAIARAGNP